MANEELRHRQGEASLKAFSAVAMTAAAHAVYGNEDDLVVLPLACPTLPGEQDDDGVRAVAAIDVLRYLVTHYEDEQEDTNG